MNLTERDIEVGNVVTKIYDIAYEVRSSYLNSGRMPTRKIKKLRDYLDKVFAKALQEGEEVKTNLIGFRKLYGRQKNNWFGLWWLDGRELTDAEARIFVDRAIAAGYTYDEDVPEDKIREWIGWTKKGSEVAK